MIRPAIVNDLDAIRGIYNYYVAHSTCTFQIEQESALERQAWFRNRTSKHPVVVAETEGEVMAWAALSPWKSRCGYVGSVESSVYVRHDRQHRGIGRKLMLKLIERANEIGYHTLIAGVCSEQPHSIALHKNLGFQEVAHFRETGRKFDRWLDVIYLQLMLKSS